MTGATSHRKDLPARASTFNVRGIKLDPRLGFLKDLAPQILAEHSTPQNRPPL
jgi:hypothetical protein